MANQTLVKFSPKGKIAQTQFNTDPPCTRCGCEAPIVTDEWGNLCESCYERAIGYGEQESQLDIEDIKQRLDEAESALDRIYEVLSDDCLFDAFMKFHTAGNTAAARPFFAELLKRQGQNDRHPR